MEEHGRWIRSSSEIKVSNIAPISSGAIKGFEDAGQRLPEKEDIVSQANSYSLIPNLLPVLAKLAACFPVSY